MAYIKRTNLTVVTDDPFFANDLANVELSELPTMLGNGVCRFNVDITGGPIEVGRTMEKIQLISLSPISLFVPEIVEKSRIVNIESNLIKVISYKFGMQVKRCSFRTFNGGLMIKIYIVTSKGAIDQLYLPTHLEKRLLEAFDVELFGTHRILSDHPLGWLAVTGIADPKHKGYDLRSSISNNDYLVSKLISIGHLPALPDGDILDRDMIPEIQTITERLQELGYLSICQGEVGGEQFDFLTDVATDLGFHLIKTNARWVHHCRYFLCSDFIRKHLGNGASAWLLSCVAQKALDQPYSITVGGCWESSVIDRYDNIRMMFYIKKFTKMDVVVHPPLYMEIKFRDIDDVENLVSLIEENNNDLSGIVVEEMVSKIAAGVRWGSLPEPSYIVNYGKKFFVVHPVLRPFM